MKDILKSRKDAGLLLAPVLYEFCCRLWYVAAAFSPESEALLFMARGGLRLQYLFDLFLKVNELEMPVRKHPMTGEIIRIPPLYSRNGETVFELPAMPGKYELYRIIR